MINHYWQPSSSATTNDNRLSYYYSQCGWTKVYLLIKPTQTRGCSITMARKGCLKLWQLEEIHNHNYKGLPIIKGICPLLIVLIMDVTQFNDLFMSLKLCLIWYVYLLVFFRLMYRTQVFWSKLSWRWIKEELENIIRYQMANHIKKIKM
jgi:hypothetical protein